MKRNPVRHIGTRLYSPPAILDLPGSEPTGIVWQAFCLVYGLTTVEEAATALGCSLEVTTWLFRSLRSGEPGTLSTWIASDDALRAAWALLAEDMEVPQELDVLDDA